MPEEKKVRVGFYDSEVSGPVYDDAWGCPVCGEPLYPSNREVIAILIHCTRWPLCTFVRFHKDELWVLGDIRYNEIVVEALLERDRIERERTKVPELFRNAFNI